MKDDASNLCAAVKAAAERRQPVKIAGSGSKKCVVGAASGALLSVLDHSGVIDYKPEELYVTVRAGTPLRELRAVLAAEHQILPCDPPMFAGRGTVGGAIASGLSGPARPWRGAVRDCLLGLEVVNGLGDRLNFGGQVMKNVAGYDITRLMAGAEGRLGVILSATFKVLPASDHELTLLQICTADDALDRVRSWARQPLPLSATAFHEGKLYMRLSGTEAGVLSARETLGGEVEDGARWATLRDHEHEFFKRYAGVNGYRLWRLWLPPNASLASDGDEPPLVEWSGAQRWLWTQRSSAEVRQNAVSLGGSAVCYHSDIQLPRDDWSVTQRVKAAFDPHFVLNRLEGEAVAH